MKRESFTNTIKKSIIMSKTKLLLLAVVSAFAFTSCEIETIDNCQSCELTYDILNTSSLSSTELDELAVESGWANYDEYFAVTHDLPETYCDSALTDIIAITNTEDLDDDGSDDLKTYWNCQ